MGVWNAIECWFLRLVLGIRSSVDTLALPLRPLYSNISLLSFLLFLRDSHFNCPRMPVILPVHNCNYLSQIWQRTFARFLILPGELHLGDPKPNCHNPGLGAPILMECLGVFGTRDRRGTAMSGLWGQVYRVYCSWMEVSWASVDTV